MENENIISIKEDMEKDKWDLEEVEEDIKRLENCLKNQRNAKELILERLASSNKDLYNATQTHGSGKEVCGGDSYGQIMYCDACADYSTNNLNKLEENNGKGKKFA